MSALVKRSYLPYLDTWAEWIMRDMPRTDEMGIQHEAI